MTEIRTGLTYDDVLLVPRRSRVRSRQDVSTRAGFTPGIELEVPIVSANMDTVTMAPMAVAMAQLGGIGVLHRFLSIEDEAASALGWTGATPYLTLAFLALSVIPSLKITDRGLVDVDLFEIVPLEVA